MCGSGMKAAMFAHDVLLNEKEHILVAGGMESMTNAPYLLPKARAGLRMGHAQVIDHMFYDGLEDAYDKGRLMGTFAEDCAQKYAFSRQAQDEFAIASLQRAQKANKEGWFAWETTPLALKPVGAERAEGEDRRPRRDQRGLRGGGDGGDEGAGPAARQGKRAGRRLRARPSDRRLGRAQPGDAHRRAAQVRHEARRREPVHRRRRGYGDGGRAGLALFEK